MVLEIYVKKMNEGAMDVNPVYKLSKLEPLGENI